MRRRRRMGRPVLRALAAWRRLGPAAASARALAVAADSARAFVRRRRLRRRPLALAPGELERALGGLAPIAALRDRALSAMPTLAEFDRDLERVADADRAVLLAAADEVLAHRFDLLGSGPTYLGERIDWQRDFKSGRSWPLEHISKVPFVYPDESDIAVPLKLSHGDHLPLLAMAHRLTGERRYLDELGAQLTDWIERNPVEFGANWVCTMDVAIRAANWVAALVLCADAAEREPWLRRALESLVLHGRFIRGHLEDYEVRNNHYLSDIVGLLVVATVFATGPEGEAWARWGARELVAEMDHQVRADGVAHEMSTSYHRLVCELFLWGTEVVDALVPGALPRPYRERLDRMLDFVRDYTRPDGLAPQIGDGGDHRFLPLADAAGADPRYHLHLFGLASRPYRPAERSAAYAEGGFYVMRAGDIYVIVRCGDAGLGGLGGHAHNDLLSFELALGPQPMVVDPGTYVYAADPEARCLFRSTGFHSTLRVDGAEQNELTTDPLYRLPAATYAEKLIWEADGRGAVLVGRHHGFRRLDPPALHTRRFELSADALVITDTVTCAAGRTLEWTFPLPGGRVVARDGAVSAEFERGRLTIECAELDFAVEQGWYSPSYGVRWAAPFVRARRDSRPGEDLTTIRLVPVCPS